EAALGRARRPSRSGRREFPFRPNVSGDAKIALKIAAQPQCLRRPPRATTGPRFAGPDASCFPVAEICCSDRGAERKFRGPYLSRKRARSPKIFLGAPIEREMPRAQRP